MKCLGYPGAPCANHVDPLRGGARCSACRPVDLTDRPPTAARPVVRVLAGPRDYTVFGHADIADAIRRTGGNFDAAAALVGCSSHTIRRRVSRSESLQEILAVALRKGAA